ncbi:ABC-type dipeptide/oligopeptide/nickel transport system permease subunit [Variovorax sp. GrIS 2.14]
MASSVDILQLAPEANTPFVPPRLRWLRKNPTLVLGLVLLAMLIFAAVAAPRLAPLDPQDMDPMSRLQWASATHWLGTDALGRDVFSRALWGGRVSLLVGFCVSVLATCVGAFLGLVAGFMPKLDGLLMRLMDSLMAIPGILLAIALMAITQPSIWTVVVAITIPETPRVVRLVRSLALTLR